ESAANTAELTETFANYVRFNVQLDGGGNRGSGVQDVVFARNTKLKFSQIGSRARMQAEAGPEAARGRFRQADGLIIGLGMMPVGDDSAAHGRQNHLDILVVEAEDGGT